MILSIGIDVGTTTFHMVLNRLQISTSTLRGPRLTGAETLYEGPVRFTPYANDRIDEDAVLQAIESDLLESGVRAEDIDTGAVIVTGEAARTENARRIVERLSHVCGTMVSTVAGGLLEALIAGRAAGAEAASRDLLRPVVNVDIGGGTSNVAAFIEGEPVKLASLNIGARMVRFDDYGRVASITPATAALARECGIDLRPGMPHRAETLLAADAVADRLAVFLDGGPLPRYLMDVDDGGKPVPAGSLISITGGVGALMADPPDDDLAYADLGVALARALRKRLPAARVRPAASGIRATVLGASVHLMQLSGTTIYLSSPTIVPLADVRPVRVVPGETEDLEARIAAAMRLGGPVACYVETDGHLGYADMANLGDALANAAESLGLDPLVTVFPGDVAKAFGYYLENRFAQSSGPRPGVLSVDGIVAGPGTLLDFGAPLPGGILPVTAKTLHFASEMETAE